MDEVWDVAAAAAGSPVVLDLALAETAFARDVIQGRLINKVFLVTNKSVRNVVVP